MKNYTESHRYREDSIPRITVQLNNSSTNITEGREVYQTKWNPTSRLLQSTVKTSSPARRFGSTTGLKRLNSRVFDSPLLNSKQTDSFASSNKKREFSSALLTSSLLRNSKSLLGKFLASIFKILISLFNLKFLLFSESKHKDSHDYSKNLELKLNYESGDSGVRTLTSDRTSNVSLHKSSVQIAVRVRPFIKQEKEISGYDVVVRDKEVLVKHDNKRENPLFKFDYAFDSTKSDSFNFYDQEKVYCKIGRQVLDYSLEGYNTCLFAYGQSGSGKFFLIFFSFSPFF